MIRRCWPLALTILLLPTLVRAETTCRPAGDLSSGLQKFMRDLAAADRAGHGEVAIQDFLAGVTRIAPKDQAALNHRGPVKVTSAGAGTGSTANDAQSGLEFEGVFAYRQTFFKVPQQIRSNYAISADKIVLKYQEYGALQFGEAIPLVGIPFYRTLDHAVVTSTKLSFFWVGNSGADPDRCYVSG